VDLSWGPDDVARVDELAALGFTVTITGGVTRADLATFAGHPVGIVIAGRSIVDAKDPLEAAAELQQALGELWRVDHEKG
jgi:3-dehydro-L-gulonate-6-phosphate decarboxylase